MLFQDGGAVAREQFAATFAADDAVGERVVELEGCTDCKRKFAHSQGIAVAQLHDRQIFRFNLDYCDIRLIGADNLPGKSLSSFNFTSILSAPSTT